MVEDHDNAQLLAKSVAHNKKVHLNLNTVQTNIVVIDVSPSGKDANGFKEDLEKIGLKVHVISKTEIRMVTYRGVTKNDVISAAEIFNNYCDAIV